MRRKDREITDFSKMVRIMNSCDCCRLGFVDGNEAYIVPMNFGYEINDEQLALFFHCAKEGRKIALIKDQTIVSFEMDTRHELVVGDLPCDYTYLYQSIMGVGTLKLISDNDEKIYGLNRIMSHYSTEKWTDFDEKLVDKTNVLKLSVKKWSCKEH